MNKLLFYFINSALVILLTLSQEVCAQDFENAPYQSPLSKCLRDTHIDFTQPLSLCELVDFALNNNPSTHKTWARARAACYQVGVAKSKLYPQIQVNATATMQDDRSVYLPSESPLDQGMLPPNTTDEFFYYTLAELSLNYLLLDFGGRGAAINSAKYALNAAQWQHQQQLQSVMIAVIRAYTKAQELQALVDAKKEDLKNAQTSYEAASQQFQAGLKTKVDVLQAKSEVLNAQLKLADADGQAHIAFGELAKAIGLPAHFPLQVQAPPKEFLEFQKISMHVDKLVETAKASRADLAAAIAYASQTEEDITIARSAGLPTLSASADFQRYDYWHSFKNRAHQYWGGIGLNFPLFSGFLYENLTRKAEAEHAAACAMWEEMESQIILEVFTNYYQFQTATEEVHFSEEYKKYSEEAHALALKSYSAGIGSILDLLATQASLGNARARAIQAKSKWMTALSNLTYSIGKL